MTIYVDDPDTTVCGGLQKEIQMGECWNSTWAYYSIDMCDIGALNAPSSTPSATPSSSSSPSSSPSPSPATLAAAIIGALAGLALLLGLILWLLRRKSRAKKHMQEMHQHGAYARGVEVEASPFRGEMDASAQRHEVHAQEKTVYAHRAVEVDTPAVELGGMEVGRGEGWGR